MNKTIPVIAFATLVLAGCGPTATNSVPTTSPSATSVPIVIKDGVFESEGSYTSPAGPETIKVKLTVANGAVSDVVVEPQATHPKSKFMQEAFAGGIRSEVVGKKLAELNITKVAGSSLTGAGFNSALEKIKAQM